MGTILMRNPRRPHHHLRKGRSQGPPVRIVHTFVMTRANPLLECAAARSAPMPKSRWILATLPVFVLVPVGLALASCSSGKAPSPPEGTTGTDVDGGGVGPTVAPQ